MGGKTAAGLHRRLYRVRMLEEPAAPFVALAVGIAQELVEGD